MIKTLVDYLFDPSLLVPTQAKGKSLNDCTCSDGGCEVKKEFDEWVRVYVIKGMLLFIVWNIRMYSML